MKHKKFQGTKKQESKKLSSAELAQQLETAKSRLGLAQKAYNEVRNAFEKELQAFGVSINSEDIVFALSIKAANAKNTLQGVQGSLEIAKAKVSPLVEKLKALKESMAALKPTSKSYKKLAAETAEMSQQLLSKKEEITGMLAKCQQKLDRYNSVVALMDAAPAKIATIKNAKTLLVAAAMKNSDLKVAYSKALQAEGAKAVLAAPGVEKVEDALAFFANIFD